MRALLLCLAATVAFSVKTFDAFVTDDTHIEHKNSTCALTEDEKRSGAFVEADEIGHWGHVMTTSLIIMLLISFV